VHALGERKTRLFLQAPKRESIRAAGAEALLKAPGKRHQNGRRLIEQNTTAILHAAGLEHHFDVCVDGLVAGRRSGSRAEPDPALFLEAAHRLGVEPPRNFLFEDALAGVEAGKRGGFDA
jgi:beta-phosphoglucomutase-like phosphatase (HAD superfamily)